MTFRKRLIRRQTNIQPTHLSITSSHTPATRWTGVCITALENDRRGFQTSHRCLSNNCQAEKTLRRRRHLDDKWLHLSSGAAFVWKKVSEQNDQFQKNAQNVRKLLAVARGAGNPRHRRHTVSDSAVNKYCQNARLRLLNFSTPSLIRSQQNFPCGGAGD